MSELIQRTDDLNTGREKLNAAIKKVDYFQTQLNTIVVEGDSSVEAAQARVDADNNTFTTLKDRLDTKESQFTAQLAQTQQDFTAQLAQTQQDLLSHESTTVDDGVHGLIIESGTFTPNINGSTSSSYYSDRIGIYYKVNNLVYFYVFLKLKLVAAAFADNVEIIGLPFTAKAPSTGFLSALFLTRNTNYPNLEYRISNNVIQIRQTAQHSTLVKKSQLTDDTSFQISSVFTIN